MREKANVIESTWNVVTCLAVPNYTSFDKILPLLLEINGIKLYLSFFYLGPIISKGVPIITLNINVFFIAKPPPTHTNNKD